MGWLSLGHVPTPTLLDKERKGVNHLQLPNERWDQNFTLPPILHIVREKTFHIRKLWWGWHIRERKTDAQGEKKEKEKKTSTINLSI